MKHAAGILQSIREIAFCYLTELDVVRHPLVQKIIEAYERQERAAEQEKDNGKKQ